MNWVCDFCGRDESDEGYCPECEPCLSSEDELSEQDRWNALYKELEEIYFDDDVSYLIDHTDRPDDFKPENLKKKTLKELENLMDDYIWIWSAIKTFDDISDDEGWEHNFDD